MTPILVVSAAAVLGLVICNLAWSGYCRGIRGRNRVLTHELRALKGDVDALPVLRADLGALNLRSQELVRALFPGQPLPATALGCLDRVEESLEVHRKANRAVRKQLSRTVDRLRQSQKEIKRLQNELMSARVGEGRDLTHHLKAAVSEQDSLARRMEGVKRSMGSAEAGEGLRQARQELEEMRMQLRSAYRAIADLETQLTLGGTKQFQEVENIESTELVHASGPSEFEIM